MAVSPIGIDGRVDKNNCIFTKGLNLWASFGGPTPQRRARLYRTLVDDGRAAAVEGSFVATADPYLFMVSVTAADGTPVTELRDLTLAALDTVGAGGVPPDEVARAQRQLQARIVLENNSITNIGHQVGFFETVAGPGVLAQLPARIAAVTSEDVARVAARYLAPTNRTVGWFQPR